MTDHMIRFPRPNGFTVLVPLSSGRSWFGADTNLRIVDSGYKGRNRYAVCRNDGTVVGFAQSVDAAHTMCQRAAF